MLLIPIGLDKRISGKSFRRTVDALFARGAAHFANVNGKVLLFAEYQGEYGRSFGRFGSAYRKASGARRIKAGTDVPIAVAVPEVRIRKRLDFEAIVRRALDDLARRIERRL